MTALLNASAAWDVRGAGMRLALSLAAAGATVSLMPGNLDPQCQVWCSPPNGYVLPCGSSRSRARNLGLWRQVLYLIATSTSARTGVLAVGLTASLCVTNLAPAVSPRRNPGHVLLQRH